jgi:hypothetical protein
MCRWANVRSPQRRGVFRILTTIKVARAADRLDGRSRSLHRKEQLMLDVILLAVGLGFFALSIAYAFGCDRL